MFARVSSYEGDAEPLREGFQRATDPLEQIPGFERAYFLIDSDSGKAMSITMWESREALEVSAEAANRLRQDATEPSGATIKSVETYEVAITVGE
jgi:heme-degrading monooxygenase HmoA